MTAARIVVAMIFGTFSGFLIYVIAALLYIGFEPKGMGLSTMFFLATFGGGWLFSSFLMLWNAGSISKVFSRGFLIGAAEWMLMIVVGFIYAGRAAVSLANATNPNSAARFLIGGGLIALLTGGFSLLMAMICLIGFAVSYAVSREVKAKPVVSCGEQWQQFLASYCKMSPQEQKVAFDSLSGEQKRYLSETLKRMGPA